MHPSSEYIQNPYMYMLLMNVPIVMMVKSIQYSSTVILNEEKLERGTPHNSGILRGVVARGFIL